MTESPATGSHAGASSPGGEDGVLERTVRLFEFLRRAQQLKTRAKTPKTLDAYRRDGDVFWFADLPEHPAIRSGHSLGAPGPDDVVLEVDRVPRRSPPAPPEDVRDWVEGALDDPETEPRLRDELLIEGHGATEPQRQSGTTNTESEPPRTVRLGDEPDVRARLDEWLTAWRRWAVKEREDRPARQLYEQLFSISLRVTEHPEEFELVLGVGCLAWRPADHDPVLRHLLTAPIRIDFDEDTGRLSVGRAEAPESLRVELDMLDPALLGDPQRIQDVRADAGDVESHPLNRDELGPLVRRIVHTLDPNAAYGDEDEPPAYEDDPRACFAPAVVLRKRSQQGLVDIFDRILEQLRTTGEVPEGIRPLVDPDHTPDPGLEWDESEGGVISVDEEPFLPLPVNDAQLRVIRRVDHSAQTLVQGPPGTGKTHTAGALISHLLAQGKRVLVTAHTDRALREVRDKLPETIKPLSVALVGASREDMADLKVAVESIGQRAADEDPEFGASRAAATVQGHLDDIDDLRRHRAGVHRDLVDAREHEVRQHQHGPYHGTLAAIAQQHQDDRSAYGWIDDLVAPASEDPPPLSNDQIAEWRTYLLDAQLRADECEANQDLIDPDSLPPPDAFARLVSAEQAAARVSADHETLRQHAGFEAVAALDQEVRTALQERLHELAREADALAGRHEQWLNAALADICAGKTEIWKARAQQIEDLTASATTLIDRLGPLTDVRTTVEDPASLLPLARTVLDHLQSGGKLRTQADGTPKIAFLTKKAVKESESLFTSVTVNGVPPTTPEQLEAFLSWAEATRYLDALDKAWPASVTIPAEDTLAERLQWHITELGPLKRVLRLGEQLGAEEQRMRQVGIPTPDWNDLSDVHTFAALVDAAAAVDSHADAREPLEELESFLADAACWEDAAPVIPALRDAAQHRDFEGYRAAHQQVVRLVGSREALARRDELGLTLAHQAPRLHQAVLNDPENAAWTERFRDFERAWKWAAAKTWITGEQQLDVNALQADLAVTENRIRRHVEDLAATRAWAHAVSPDRLTGTARANLQHYAYLVRRLGKGTGKYAPQRRRETRQAMDRCRDSVPVWIMPIYRIAEQLNVSQDMFDVVVVDEASQTGLEATFLQYVAPKIVVIGDDKQVSPTATGIELQQLRDLARQYLADDPYRASWQDPQRSLFDEARMRYGGLITLVEHRRCVPEIIGFSNRIAYEREGIRLVPVRQYGADRLEPIKPTFLPDGYTKGDKQRVNPVEVEAVVEQVEKCIADPAYDGKTFGVISLLGAPQANRIEKELLERVPPEEWTARDLRCGTAADFQGSERDVTFLSMVEAPEPGRRLGVLNQGMHLQRFNVAASRAKDQMWVFHSLSLGDIANRECMRFQLLDYCHGVVNRSEATDEITWTTQVPEDRPVEPFDSLFEQRVFNRVVDRGLTVIPQYPVEYRRIDLVVVGPKARLAVECDGDFWHGPEQYEKDLARQRELERCGWRFVHIRESDFYVDPAAALRPLWEALEELEIRPSGWIASPEPKEAGSSDAADSTSREGPVGQPPAEPTLPTEPAAGAGARLRAQSRQVGLFDEPPGHSARESPPTPGPPSENEERTPAGERVDAEGSASGREETEADAPGHVPGMQRYEAFQGQTVPVWDAGRQTLIDGVVDVVRTEGPVLGHRLQQAYVRSSGGQRIGKHIKRALNVAITEAVRKGLLVEDNPLQESGVHPKTYRLPEQEPVRLRTSGPRSLEQIPPRELATLMRITADQLGGLDHKDLFRQTLAALDWTRVTSNVERRLKQIRRLLDDDDLGQQ